MSTQPDRREQVARKLRTVADLIADGAPVPLNVCPAGVITVSVAAVDADEWCALLDLAPVVYDTEGPHAGRYGTSMSGDFQVSCYRVTGAPVSA